MVSKLRRLPPGIRISNASVKRGTFFLLKQKKTSQNTFRIGFVISKKIDKRATRRNRIRRVLSNEIESIESTKLAGYDILCILTKPIRPEDEALLRKEFKFLLSQI